MLGKQAGAEKGSGTRSSLMWCTVDIVEALKPKFVIWENVKNLLSKKHIHNFNGYIEVMDQLGYNSYYQVLNAKDYSIPQNRERVYTISIRKDVDNGSFKFPEKEELKLRLKDMLEDSVNEKYYLSNEKIEKIAHWNAYQKPFERVQGENSIVPTITARGAGEEHSGMITYGENLKDTTNLQEHIINQNASFQIEAKIEVIGNYSPSNHDASRIVDEKGISPTIKENHGTVTAVAQKISEEKNSYIAEKYSQFVNKNGYIPQMYNPYNNSEIKDIAPTQSTQCGSTTSSSTVLISESATTNADVIAGQFQPVDRNYHKKQVQREEQFETRKDCLSNAILTTADKNMIVENKVDEKYYLNEKQINKIQNSNFVQERKKIQETDICDTLLARDYKDPKCVRVGGIFDTENSKHQAGSVYSKEGISPALDCMQGGYRQPMITISPNEMQNSIIDNPLKGLSIYGWHFEQNVYSEDSKCCRSVKAGGGSGNIPKIITHNITQKVYVRKYPVNKEKLQKVLRDAKVDCDVTNEWLKNQLNIPLTTIEHWFRKDNDFSIPQPEHWFKLKELLKIETNEFDESITTFIEKENNYDKSNRVYDELGLAPTLTHQEEKILTNKIIYEDPLNRKRMA